MFDPTGHAGLQEEAAVLEPAALTAQARLAERLLRVDPLAYDSLDDAEKKAWADMVLLQIDYQMGTSAVLTHHRIGDVQQSFRAGGPVSPDARLIRDAFFATADTATSNGSWGIDGIFDANE
jgi:hypothetical protein